MQLYGYFHVWLAHFIVVSPGAKALRDHLDSDLSIRNTVSSSLAILMGLKLKAVLPFVSFFIQQVENDFSILHRLASVLPHHNNIDRRYFRLLVLLGGSGGERDERQAEEEYGF